MNDEALFYAAMASLYLFLAMFLAFTIYFR